MKTPLNGVAPATSPQERAKILAAFDSSGLSGAAFARQHRIKYTTFCFWRQQRDKAKSSVAFTEVELAAVPEPIEVLVELGSQAWVRLCSAAQISLVAGLVRELNASRPC
jgi:hypothetical protein